MPTFVRDLFSYRMAMRCTSPDASDTILGQGWATRGYSAATIDPAQRGVGYLLAEGGVPRRFRAPYFTDEDVAVLAHRAEVLAERAVTRPPAAAVLAEVAGAGHCTHPVVLSG